MKIPMKRLTDSLAVLSSLACLGLVLPGSAAAGPEAFTGQVKLVDPAGDDFGPGSYLYPTDAVYKPGSFDITSLEVKPVGEDVEFRVTVNSRIEDPWDSKAWGGNGFSVQMAFVFIDQGGQPGTGVTKGLPGLNIRFAPENAWEKVVLLSPQGPTRLNSEIDVKAADLKGNIVVPRLTRAQGRTLIAVVGKDQLGGAPEAHWGYQVAMQSNEGFPDKTDLLTRKVNEYEGQHRFGGGTDYDNDPHPLDILAGQARGDPSEVEAQKQAMSTYNVEATEPKFEDLAVLPMIYPFRQEATSATAELATSGAPGPVGPAMASPGAPASAPAVAGPGNIEFNGKIYTKWMFQNDDTIGCLSLSNPFWSDNIGGHNGACTEFELNIRGRVSDRVSAGATIQSRWGALWQDWWENGDTRWDFPTNTPFTENTSGESLGMNHAAYIKLRAAWARIAAPIPTVRWIHVGSSDFGMFNEWTIGKSRYIDRNNGYGVFVEGAWEGLSYHTAAVGLPKLYIGPRWNTGLTDADPLAGFWGADWAYAAKLGYSPIDDLALTLISAYVNDVEADKFDPDVTGTPDADRGADHAINWDDRFRALNTTLEAVYTPSVLESVSVRGLLAHSMNHVNHEYATNAVQNDQGFSPLVYRFDNEGNSVGIQDLAGKLRVEVDDPLGMGLSFKGEYFNIGSDYNAIFGSRREADVLLTDGIIGGGFITGGQLPTLNIANEFVDFDEPWYEAIIGWHGGTALLEYVMGRARLSGEYTYINYNTNMQGRDVDTQYPDFLYTDGFTDVSSYTADQDYANVHDRGRDPRSVYKEFQERRTQIAALGADLLVPGVENLTLKAKLKYVHDVDFRKDDNLADTYRGDNYLAFAQLGYQFTNELKGTLGYEFTYWDEKNRGGSQSQGFFDYTTRRHLARAGISYVFGGANFGYMLEYFHKDQFRQIPGVFNQSWRVIRSKAFLEVGW